MVFYSPFNSAGCIQDRKHKVAKTLHGQVYYQAKEYGYKVHL